MEHGVDTGFFFPDCAWFEGVSPSKELGGGFFFTQKEQKLRVSACFFVLSKSENDFPPSFCHFFFKIANVSGHVFH